MKKSCRVAELQSGRSRSRSNYPFSSYQCLKFLNILNSCIRAIRDSIFEPTLWQIVNIYDR